MTVGKIATVPAELVAASRTRWAGKAARMSAAEVVAVAEANGIPPVHLRAVLQVEALGSGFDSIGRPVILPEGHVLYRQLKAAGDAQVMLGRAVVSGLAWPKWGMVPYPKTQDGKYLWLARASTISEEHAVRACSWGLAQVLGENYKLVGFPSAVAMAEYCAESEPNQLELMLRFCRARGIMDDLARGGQAGFERFTRVYNGPGQVALYTGRILAAVKALGGTAGKGVVPVKTVPVAAVGKPVVAVKASGSGVVAPKPKTAPMKPVAGSASKDAEERKRTAELNEWALFSARNPPDTGDKTPDTETA